ncbi:MAG: hypothetical protein N2691_00070 [Patescibacteria group bacterium]|nr:hypothetical protein [Patescibacteria group bacterium]
MTITPSRGNDHDTGRSAESHFTAWKTIVPVLIVTVVVLALISLYTSEKSSLLGTLPTPGITPVEPSPAIAPALKREQLENEFSSGGVIDYVFAPDGSSVTYAKDGVVRVVSLLEGWTQDLTATEAASPVFNSSSFTLPCNSFIGNPSYRVDGSEVAYVTFRDGRNQIMIFNFTTRAVKNILDAPECITEIAFSPDGMWIAYSMASSLGIGAGYPVTFRVKSVTGQIEYNLAINGVLGRQSLASPPGKPYDLAPALFRWNGEELDILGLSLGVPTGLWRFYPKNNQLEILNTCDPAEKCLQLPEAFL